MPIIDDVVSSNLDQGEVYSIMPKSLSVTCDRSVVFSTNKTDIHDITEILLQVALNTTKQTSKQYISSLQRRRDIHDSKLVCISPVCDITIGMLSIKKIPNVIHENSIPYISQTYMYGIRIRRFSMKIITTVCDSGS